MPQPAKEYDNYYYYGDQRKTCIAVPDGVGRRYGKSFSRSNVFEYKKKNKKVQKNKIIARLIVLIALLLTGIFILPVAFRNITVQMLFKSPYPKIKADYRKVLFPTGSYLRNNLFMGEYMFSGAAPANKASMATLLEGEAMSGLERQIISIKQNFKDIQPSVFVWDYETGNYADINADATFSAASIIKIPVLISLFRAIEARQVRLNDTMVLKSYYRAEGSGGLQYKAENSVYTLDKLARIMITDSDNSSTNMIMSELGSMNNVNSHIRSWGLAGTELHTWLPDLEGTNHTTARELARMLYNIENSDFLSETSRLKIKDYMAHVKNNRLVASGLGPGATFLHKTGDIGKMLGDAGIVTMPNGRKYIVVIMVNRPYNSPQGKDFIVKASEIIYSYMDSI
ncbi:MAG: serine hydrolase [Alphaproteobacteria bacterium]|nr:serine hydrolase [Alphaproteobacteria bacterium]